MTARSHTRTRRNARRRRARRERDRLAELVDDRDLRDYPRIEWSQRLLFAVPSTRRPDWSPDTIGRGDRP